MTDTTYLDKHLFPDSLNSLVLYLENCDGNSWNELRSRLEMIFKTVPANGYLPLASAVCNDFVTHWFWKAFPERDSFKTQWLINNRSRLVTAACVAIAHGELAEFQLGNFAA